MQLFSADATIFKKKIEKLKKTPSKVGQKYSNFCSPIAAQTAQTEEFMFQNVAYRPTVYRTGVHTKKLIDRKKRIFKNFAFCILFW